MPIDPVSKKVNESEARLAPDYQNNPVVMDALQKSPVKDLYKILEQYGLTTVEFERFIADRGNFLATEVIKADPITEGASTFPAPDIEAFPMQDPSNTLSDNDSKAAGDLLVKAMTGGKASTLGKAKAEGAASAPDFEQIKNDYEDFNSYWQHEIEPLIMEQQFSVQMKTETAKFEAELQKVVEAIKRHEIDPVFMVLAIVKYNVMSKGILFSQKVSEYKKSMDRQDMAFDVLKKQGDANPPTNAALITAQQDIKQETQAGTLVLNDLNQIMSHIQTINNVGKGIMDTYFEHLKEGVRKVDPAR